MRDERELLMIPGPTNIDPAVLRMLAKPTQAHTSPGFLKFFREALEYMKKVMMTENQPMIVGGTGTLGMEIAVANVVEPGDRVLSVCNGYFGERFADIAERHGGLVDRMRLEWGNGADPGAVEAQLDKTKYKAVTVVHVDTSTGAANPVKDIASRVAKTDALLLLDTVCSLGGMEVRVDDWMVDACLAGSQKALAVPPGLVLLSIGARALEVRRKRKGPPRIYYGDFENWLPIMMDPTRYFATPPVNLVYALHESLRRILDEGLEPRFRRHAVLAERFRNEMRLLGLKIVAEEEYYADTMTALYYPDGIVDAAFRRALMDEYGIVVAGGLERLKEKIFRVGHMGNVDIKDILATSGGIKETLASMKK